METRKITHTTMVRVVVVGVRGKVQFKRIPGDDKRIIKKLIGAFHFIFILYFFFFLFGSKIYSSGESKTSNSESGKGFSKSAKQLV